MRPWPKKYRVKPARRAIRSMLEREHCQRIASDFGEMNFDRENSVAFCAGIETLLIQSRSSRGKDEAIKRLLFTVPRLPLRLADRIPVSKRPAKTKDAHDGPNGAVFPGQVRVNGLNPLDEPFDNGRRDESGCGLGTARQVAHALPLAIPADHSAHFCPGSERNEPTAPSNREGLAAPHAPKSSDRLRFSILSDEEAVLAEILCRIGHNSIPRMQRLAVGSGAEMLFFAAANDFVPRLAEPLPKCRELAAAPLRNDALTAFLAAGDFQSNAKTWGHDNDQMEMRRSSKLRLHFPDHRKRSISARQPFLERL